MPKFTVSLKLFEEFGYTVWFVRDTCLIVVDHRIPIGCDTLLQASRASSRDVNAIKKLIKIFSLTCNWLFVKQQMNQVYVLLECFTKRVCIAC